MTTAELTGLFHTLPALRGEVAIEMQPGLPEFLRLGGELCVRFRPHKMAVEDGMLCFGAPRYEIILTWPFRHMVLYKNLGILESLPEGPVCRIDAATALTPIQSYYAQCDELLASRARGEALDEERLSACREAFADCVSTVGLIAVYGG